MKTKQIHLFFLIALHTIYGYSQSIEKFSIDSGGGSVTVSGIQIFYTIGEVNVQELSAEGISISEGFINPGINGSILSTENNLISNNQIKIYPNPAKFFININSEININKIDFLNILGKRIFTSKKTNQIDISKFPAGIYILKIFADKKTLTKKIIIK